MTGCLVQVIVTSGYDPPCDLETGMNFVQWLNSLDELLYELMSWLVFVPVTLWRIVTRPLATMRYAEEQLALEDGRQYRATVSPPVMLILSVALSQAIDLAIGYTNPIVASRRGLAGLVNDNLTLLLLRVVLFGVFPLLLAVRKVQRAGARVDRDTLKPPFYAQCYAASPLAFLISAGTAGINHAVPEVQLVGSVAVMLGFIFYAVIQVRWFGQELGQSVARSVFDTAAALITGIVIFFLVGVLFVR